MSYKSRSQAVYLLKNQIPSLLRERHWLLTFVNAVLLLLVALSVIAAISFLAISATSAIRFTAYHRQFLRDSDPPSAWTDFATFIGFVIQTAISASSLIAAIFLAIVVTRRIEQQKAQEQKHRELIRLSEKMVDTEFYLKVMYPAWEVALKWIGMTGPEGDAYRAEVVGAELQLPRNYSFRQGASALAENSPRFHPHFHPYDVPIHGQTASINELSESLAFATWIRFWRNIKFLLDHDLLDKDSTRHLFREWYMWWAPFMTEFTWVCIATARRLRDEFGYTPIAENWSQSSTVKLIELHRDFGISSHCGYRRKGDLRAAVLKLRDGIWKDVERSIKNDPNFDIDGRVDESNETVIKLREKADVERALRYSRLTIPT